MSFSVSSSVEHSDAVVVTVRGTVEHTTIGSLCDTINDIVDQRRPALVNIDLRSVTYIDAAVVGALDACQRSARYAGTSVVLRNASDAVDRTLRMST
ncbi:STAS domain-containing protein [Dactylosporangium sp. NPDC050688]|uniref:STAS domain-containing protein n=1 Tax=Dactylosporangium sp. NPDC050688 TaxID=3157217 RepID=UPI0033CA584C